MPSIGCWSGSRWAPAINATRHQSCGENILLSLWKSRTSGLSCWLDPVFHTVSHRVSHCVTQSATQCAVPSVSSRGGLKIPGPLWSKKILLSSSPVFPCSFLLHGGIFDRRAFSAAFLAGSASSGSPSQDSPTLECNRGAAHHLKVKTRISSNP